MKTFGFKTRKEFEEAVVKAVKGSDEMQRELMGKPTRYKMSRFEDSELKPTEPEEFDDSSRYIIPDLLRKRWRLLKELPGISKGTIFIEEGDPVRCGYRYFPDLDTDINMQYNTDFFFINNPDWFEELKPTEPQTATGNFHLLSNKLVDDNDSTTSAISAQHLPERFDCHVTCQLDKRLDKYLHEVLAKQDTVDDEITDISLEFVEMVFDMAQGKNKKKKKTFWVDKTSEKVKELLDKEIKKAYKAGMENTGSGEL